MSKILTEASIDELIAELRSRPGIVPSIWRIEDVMSIIDEHAEDNKRLAALDNEQTERFATLFLLHVGNKLEEDSLGMQGNTFLNDIFTWQADEILDEMEATPKP